MATFTFYNLFKEAQLDGNLSNTPIDFDADNIYLSLHTNTYVPSATTHDFFNDASNEISPGGGYTANGELLTTKTVNESGGTVTFDADDVTWSQNGSGFTTARYAVMYKNDGVAATSSPLIGYIDFTADKGNTTGDLTVSWNASGIFTLS